MKLIDKEALLLALRNKRYSKQSLDLIESQPVVDAIPVEWVINYLIYKGQETRLQEAITQWEKENGSE